jgi:hypothetical protein
MKLNGSSAGQLPNHLRIIKIPTKHQKKNCLNVETPIPHIPPPIIIKNGKTPKTKIPAKRATTPPNLLGIARRIAYNHRKYHSGLI